MCLVNREGSNQKAISVKEYAFLTVLTALA